MTIWLAGTLGYYSYYAGHDWDSALAAIDEAISWGPSIGDRLRIEGSAALMTIARGADPEPLIAKLDEIATDVTDPQITSAQELLRGEAKILTGDYDGAARAAMESLRLLPGYGGLSSPILNRAAIYLRDVSLARTALTTIEGMSLGDGFTQATRLWARGTVAALEDRWDEAITRIRQAIVALRDLRQDFVLALAILDVAVLFGPDDPEFRAAEPEARAIFERVGARPWLERLDSARTTKGGHRYSTKPETVPTR